MLVSFFTLVFGFNYCAAGVIEHLSDAEYERMPPVYGLDKFDQCIMLDQEGTYCTAKVELFSDTPNDLMTLIKEYSAHTFKHYNHSLLERGVCVTRNCKKFIKNNERYTETNISAPLAACINETIWREYSLQTKLLDYNCVKQNEDRQKDIYDYIFLFILYGLVLVNLAGTVCDSVVRRQNPEKNSHLGFKHYLMCFSITQNWTWLVSSEPEDARLRKLKGLHAVKTIVMYMFIMGHVFHTFHAFTENTHKFEKYYEYFWYKLLFNGLASVQILFCISGFLLVYNLLLESEKRDISWKMVPKVIMLRLWRLTPANLIYVIFSATLLRHWGNGPIWKLVVTNRMSGGCRRYWWAHLIFVNNYITDDRFCVIQNWQLSADVQLFVLGLCVFVATKANKRVLVLGSLVLLGLLILAGHIWWNDLEGFLLMSPEMYRSFGSTNFAIRKFAHVNLPAFIIGMITGHYVYKLQKENADFSRYKSILSPACSFIMPSIAFLFYTGSYFYSDAEGTSLTLRIAYGITLVSALALLTSFFIFVMVFRLSDFWIKFLEWDGWVIPGRLTYSISLIHTFFIINLLGSRTQLLHVSSLNHTVMHIGIGVLSFIFSIPYFIMVEAPFNKLVKTIFIKKPQQVKKVE